AHFQVGSQPVALVTADFNDDGRLDLAAANEATNDVSLLLGQGDGTFADQVTFAVGSSPRALVSGDFNGDGRPDLATANYASGNVAVLLKEKPAGAPVLRFADAASFAAGVRPRVLLTGDFNGDGLLDLATANYGSGDVSVLLNQTSVGANFASFDT